MKKHLPFKLYFFGVGETMCRFQAALHSPDNQLVMKALRSYIAVTLSGHFNITKD